MRNSTRLIVNTGAQYTRTVINLVLSLYSTRLILEALGLDDYGIFTLIGGVVSMLAFMTNAMVSTTQRFMSFHQTKSNLVTQQKIFSNSVVMHLLFSLLILLLLEVVGPFLFDGFLNIKADRMEAAKIVYQCAIFMILCSFITAPYRALLISHENLIYISIIDICDGLLRVGIASILIYWGTDKLILYGFLMLGVYVFNFTAFIIYDIKKYSECIFPKLKYFNKEYLKSMSSFVGWQLYSTGCIIGRVQGVAIVLNKFFGTVVNAAFGIALQVNGAINFISTALVTAINPQIVKAEGSGDRQKMLRLSEVASKFSFLLLAMLVIPICFVLPELLKAWLGNVPERSVLFSRVILITALIDQITYGLGCANSAIGNIRPYALTVNTIKIITVPALAVAIYLGMEINVAIWIYAFFEFLCAFCRLPFLKKTGGLSIRHFSKEVFLKLPIPVGFLIVVYYLLGRSGIPLLLYIGIAMAVSLIYGFIIYKCSMNIVEKSLIHGIIDSLKRKSGFN